MGGRGEKYDGTSLKEGKSKHVSRELVGLEFRMIQRYSDYPTIVRTKMSTLLNQVRNMRPTMTVQKRALFFAATFKNFMSLL